MRVWSGLQAARTAVVRKLVRGFPGWLLHVAPYCMDFSIELLESPNNMAAGFLQSKRSKRERETNSCLRRGN